MDGSDGGGVSVDAVIGYALSQFTMKAVENPVQRLLLIMTVRREIARQQQQKSTTTTEGEVNEEEIKGFFSLVKRIWQREGVMGALRGLLTDACFSVPCFFNDVVAQVQAAKLMNGVVQAVMQADGGELTPLKEVMLNVVHSAVVMLMTIPTTSIRETVITHLQADIKSNADDALRAPRHRFTGPFDCMQQLYRASGRSVLGAFYRGCFVGTASMMVYRGVYYTSFTVMAAKIHPDVLNRLQMPLAFGLTILAGLLTQPFEVVRRRLMLNAAVEKKSEIAAAANSESRRYSGIVDCCKTIRREAGWLGFYDGLGSRMGFSCCLLVVRVLTTSE